ncbi:MAG: hypothetical protein ACRDRW_17140 [Pseudonocardiaceae bacterium]
MTSWRDVVAAEPHFADHARRTFAVRKHATLATLRRDGSPRISGTEVDFFADHTPLWYYIFKEAELIQKGHMLGPVGGPIVAEVFIGLLLGDSQSYFVAEPGFQPKAGRFGALHDGQFGIADLIRRAVIDPQRNN